MSPFFPKPEKSVMLQLPHALEMVLDTSVKEFRKQWGMMLGYAESQGYILNYSKEIRRIAELGYLAGVEAEHKAQSANGTKPLGDEADGS
jgi:hypothetical protein